MRFRVTRLVAVIIMALVALAGCNSNDKTGRSSNAPTPPRPGQPAQQQQPAPPSSINNVRRITTAELEEALKKGQAFVVDVRNDAAFKLGHIKNSILIPYTDVANHLDKIPRDKLIVTYCA